MLRTHVGEVDSERIGDGVGREYELCDVECAAAVAERLIVHAPLGGLGLQSLIYARQPDVDCFARLIPVRARRYDVSDFHVERCCGLAVQHSLYRQRVSAVESHGSGSCAFYYLGVYIFIGYRHALDAATVALYVLVAFIVDEIGFSHGRSAWAIADADELGRLGDEECPCAFGCRDAVGKVGDACDDLFLHHRGYFGIGFARGWDFVDLHQDV